jgi:GNAT superfamily N-acetyltransferase
MHSSKHSTPTDLPASPIQGLSVVNLSIGGEVVLQEFFEANPLYFLSVHGIPAQAGEAHEEINGELPPGWAFTQKYVFGYQDSNSKLAGMGNVVSDLLAKGVWHVGTFIVATDRHGTGDAQALYASVEAWCQACGARWMRLGVVEGNARAEAFWEQSGYVQVAKREGIEMGPRTNTIRVMAKPLFGQPISEYYATVERDRPAPTSAVKDPT